MKQNILHYCLIIGVLLNIHFIKAQGLVITPLNKNTQVQHYIKNNPGDVWLNKGTFLGITDTLELPFFEEFTGTKVYPDYTKFIDNFTYINSHFPLSPPSYGVATFDNLNEKGVPYSGLNDRASSVSDYLTSQPINLFDFQIGANRQKYKLADSIYISFFYQKGGLGDTPENGDSLVLQFRENDTLDIWNTVWAVGGGSKTKFKQAMIKVNEEKYLFNNFQFRFYNYSKNTGNMNHWHVDFIRMAQGRTIGDTILKEVAINQLPHSLLKHYNVMPYSHFKTTDAATNFPLTYRNNGENTVITRLQYEAFDQNNTLLASSLFAVNNRNILPLSDSTEIFNTFSFGTLSGPKPHIRVKYSIQPQSNDITAINYNATSDNNVLEHTQYFDDYFAYDDGSAEAGLGLEYGGLPSGEGYLANKFTATVKDTIWGVDIHLTQILQDVSSIPFSIILWKKLTSTSENHMYDDEIIYEQEVTYLKPEEVNGNYFIQFDTSQIIEPGEFYIGWRQNSKYYFNIGCDKNYQYEHSDQINPNLYYNLLGYWQPANVKHAIMLHPRVGKFADLPVSINEIKKETKALIYPNPANDIVQIRIGIEKIGKVEIYNMLGTKVQESYGDSINIINLSQGQYLLKIWDYSGNHLYTNSLIKK